MFKTIIARVSYGKRTLEVKLYKRVTALKKTI